MDALFLIGRIIFGGYFIYSGVGHFLKLEGLTGYAQSKGVPMAKLGVLASGLAMLLGGLSIVFGFMPVVGIWILVATVFVMTVMIHQFWTVTDPMHKMGEMINFNKNIALIGALLMMLGIALPWVSSI